MKDLHFNPIRNEKGAALWSVIIVSFIILLIVTSSFTYIVEHKRLLQMRLHQIQSVELVKNGVVQLKNKIATGEEIEITKYVDHYVQGWVDIRVVEATEFIVHAVISGYVSSDQFQSYEVKIDRLSNKVIQYSKKSDGKG